MLKRRIANLMAIGRGSKIEEAILAVATGVGASERVRARLCAMFPTREKEVKPETVLHNIACFQSSMACKYSPLGIQAKVTHCQAMVARIVDGGQPTITETLKDAVLEPVARRPRTCANVRRTSDELRVSSS